MALRNESLPLFKGFRHISASAVFDLSEIHSMGYPSGLLMEIVLSDSQTKPWATMADEIIAKFGGYTPMSKMTGIPISTLAHWRVQGIVPEKYRLRLLRAARANRINLKPVDYIRYMTAELVADAGSPKEN
jgi:hypothetical protein